MKVKVTERHAVCDMRCTHFNGYFDCVNCPSKIEDSDDEQVYTQEHYVDILKRGQCYITKVEFID